MCIVMETQPRESLLQEYKSTDKMLNTGLPSETTAPSLLLSLDRHTVWSLQFERSPEAKTEVTLTQQQGDCPSPHRPLLSPSHSAIQCCLCFMMFDVSPSS
ncbi:hypothetical protein HispidOSU_022527 [Sigmodon hispidus]